MKRKMYCVVSVLVLMGFVACGSSGSNDTPDETPQIKTVDELPRVTSPVVSDASGSIYSRIKAMITKATNGINLRTLDNTTFTKGDCRFLCETSNQTKNIISAAAKADLTFCYVQNVIADDTAGELPDLYDGKYHVFGLNLTSTDGEGGPDHIKMKVIKTGDVITGFEMFECSGGEQKGYTSQTISSENELAMVVKNYWTGGESSLGAEQIAVTGDLNSSGYFTSKTIEIDQYNDQGENTHWAEATVTQYPDKMIFDGYDSGVYEGGNYSNRVYSQFQLIDKNTSAANDEYDIGKIAVGDGAANAFNNSEENDDGAWDADTKLSDDTIEVEGTSTTWLSLVESTVPRKAEDEKPSITFSGAQQYACDGKEEAVIDVDQELLDAKCSRFLLNHDWIDCYSITNYE